jgi:hypothetical protein
VNQLSNKSVEQKTLSSPLLMMARHMRNNSASREAIHGQTAEEILFLMHQLPLFVEHLTLTNHQAKMLTQ